MEAAGTRLAIRKNNGVVTEGAATFDDQQTALRFIPQCGAANNFRRAIGRVASTTKRKDHMKKRENLKLRDVKPAKDPKGGGKFRPKQRRGGGDVSGRGPNVPIKNLP